MSRSRKITELVIHHTAVSNHRQPDFEKQVSSMARTHAQRLNNPGSDGSTIQYHYVVGMHGESRATRKHIDIGRHASNATVNARSLGICMTGNFDEEVGRPKQIAEMNRIIQDMIKQYGPLKISFHNEYARKTCPGKNITKSIFYPTNILMSFYKKIWTDENGKTPKNDRVFQDPQGAVERLSKLSTQEQIEELIYLMAIMAERTKTTK